MVSFVFVVKLTCLFWYFYFFRTIFLIGYQPKWRIKLPAEILQQVENVGVDELVRSVLSGNKSSSRRLVVTTLVGIEDISNPFFAQNVIYFSIRT